MDKSKVWRLLLYAWLLLALGGIMGHFTGDVLCAAQGIEMSVACEVAGGDNTTASSIVSSSNLHSGFALPASIAWAGWQILVFLALVFSYRPGLFALIPSPPPPRRIS
jgi:hypothetical protein